MGRPNFSRTILSAAVALVAGGALLAMTSGAEAAFKLSLSSGASTVVVADGGVGDANAGAGAITFIGSVGGWSTNVTTGLTNPALPGPYPHLDLASVNVSSSGAGTLTMMLTDTGFSSPNSVDAFVAAFGGTTAGNVRFTAYVNTDNGEFSTTGTKVFDFGPLSGPSFSAATSGFGAVDGAYSVTLIWTIVHNRAGVTSGDAEFQVPEPASLALFGIGLLGLGVLWRRRASQGLAH